MLTVASMTTKQHATVTFQVSLEVTDPDAFLAWAATTADRATDGQPTVWREATRALVCDVPGALRWTYDHDPDAEPPGIVITNRALDVQAVTPASR